MTNPEAKSPPAGEIQGLVERAMALANAATPGPWRDGWTYININDDYVRSSAVGPERTELGRKIEESDTKRRHPSEAASKAMMADAAFIAASRQLIPELCEAITRLSQPEIREAGRPNPFDYTALDGGALLDKLGDDAAQWAAAFNQHAVKLGYAAMDEGWLVGWFANAIEHSSDVRRGRGKPVVLPDGSSFFIGASSGSNKSDDGKKGQTG